MSKNIQQQRLVADKFNDEQIALVQKITAEYQNQKEDEHFNYDNWERDLWYTMNRSGLFEADDMDNETGIINWNPTHTRYYISEV